MESLLSCARICILNQLPFCSSFDFAPIIINEKYHLHACSVFDAQLLYVVFAARQSKTKLWSKRIRKNENKNSLFRMHDRIGSDRFGGTYIFVWHLFNFQYQVWCWWLFFARAHFYALNYTWFFSLWFILPELKCTACCLLCLHLNSSSKFFKIFEIFLLSLNPIVKFAMPQLKNKQIFFHFDFRTLRNEFANGQNKTTIYHFFGRWTTKHRWTLNLKWIWCNNDTTESTS